jgi:hypothetical protein
MYVFAMNNKASPPSANESRLAGEHTVREGMLLKILKVYFQEAETTNADWEGTPPLFITFLH